MNVKGVVAELRKAGLSESDIAVAVGCAQSTVNMWANGNRARKAGDYLLRLFRLHAEKCPAPQQDAA